MHAELVVFAVAMTAMAVQIVGMAGFGVKCVKSFWFLGLSGALGFIRVRVGIF